MRNWTRPAVAIAQAAEIGNPKRVYFVQQEIRNLSLAQLRQTLPLLLELEYGLKQGSDELALMQTKTVELCEVCRTHPQEPLRR